MTRDHDFKKTARDARGFSIIETLLVVAIAGVVAAVALPQGGRMMGAARLRADGRAIANTISLAKMRAASGYTRSRLFVNLTGNEYSLQLFDKATATWQTEGGVNHTSYGVGFGFAGLSTPPPSTQAAIHQSPACKADDGADIASTACVTFNSRGIPIDSTLSPYGENGIYITDGTGVYATTITATPLIRRWWAPAVQPRMDETVTIRPANGNADLRADASQRGFSLAEVVVAMGILTVVALGVLPLGVIATNTSENQGHLVARTSEYAQDKMEQLLVLTFGDSTSDTRIFPATNSGGKGLAVGGSFDPDAPVALYVDYLDIAGNLMPSTGTVAPAGWFYKRVWSVSQPLAGLKQITVTATVRLASGGSLTPRATISALKTSPF